MFNDFSRDSVECSILDLTSSIFLVCFELCLEKLKADSFSTLEISFPDSIQFCIPPSRYPWTLSKPTLDNLSIASFSLPTGTISNNFLETSSNISPTHGANLPSSPINIEPGIWDFANSSALLTSRIVTSLLINFSTSDGLNAFKFLFNKSSDST